MDDIMKDSRFSHISQDPFFRKIPKKEKKVKIDKRFHLMFKDKNFKLNSTVDKRGRPVVGTSSEDLKKFYDLSSDDEEEEEKESTIPSGGDIARGQVLLTDSSSDESSEVESEGEEEELDHGWGELDRDAERTDEITNRLALCHMDWDRIRAVDLMVLFNSFLPQGGHINSITIYPSEFGIKRMKEEEIKGPIELVNNGNIVKDDDDEDKNGNEEGDAYDMEKLRQYQLNRLKYYYAVLVFDSPETANQIYTDCDGLEYESSATRLDLRFIPDDTSFDQEPREVCEKMPDVSKYKPRYFTTTALQQAKVDLTWDETNPERCEINQKLMSGQVDGISEADLRNYLATSSEDESEDEEKNENGVDDDKEENSGNKDNPISKYRSLLQEIEEHEEKKKTSDVGLEITWGIGLKSKAEKLVQGKLKERNNDLTPFEQYVKKRKERKKEKKKEKKRDNQDVEENSVDDYSDDEIPSDIDLNDPYFQEEFQGEFKKKNKKNRKVIDTEEDSKQEEAELELLLMDDPDERNHFSLKSIQKSESEGKKKKHKKKKLKRKVTENKTDNFEVDVTDERFSALYTSHHFNIDPTDPHYHKTKGMEALRAEKISYRQNDKLFVDLVPSKIPKMDRTHKYPELSSSKTQQRR